MLKIIPISTFLSDSFNTPERIFVGFFCSIWSFIIPTLPFIAITTFFVFIDCFSAYLLGRRVKARYPEQSKDGKFKSEHANEVFNTLAIIYLLVIGGYYLDNNILHFIDLHIGNWIAAMFCGVQIVSVLENASSCNGSLWAKVLQKFLVDKTSRHLEIPLDKYIEEAKQELSDS